MDKVILILVRIELFILGANIFIWGITGHDIKLFEFDKVHTNNNVVDRMTKTLSRHKLEAYCEISGLMITLT